MGKADAFDVFILSDTRGADAGAAEEAAYAELKRALAGQIEVHYRRRKDNTGRKAGNIKDWVERFGGAYEFFVILDGDSIMSGATLVRLARAMEATPSAGLIQTVPKLTGGITLLQRLMQFASNVYGPAVSRRPRGVEPRPGQLLGPQRHHPHHRVRRLGRPAGSSRQGPVRRRTS